MEPAWTRICEDFARRTGIPDHEVALIDAFGAVGEARSVGGLPDFSDLETRLDATCNTLPADIATRLSGEVDPDQAAMFGRRFHAVSEVLRRLASTRPLARVLRVALACRTREVIVGEPPRALRVRALVDFYYSQAAVLHHQRDGEVPSPPEEHAGRAQWEPVVPGLALARILGPSTRGPLHAHALRVRGLPIQTRDIRGEGGGGASFTDVVRARGAVAGVSGGYFLYSEAEVLPPSRRTDPVGLLVQDGEVLSPPSFRRACVCQDRATTSWIEVRGPEGLEIVSNDGTVLRVGACNDASEIHTRSVAFNRASGTACPLHGGWSVALVGRRVVAVGRGALPIPLAGFVLTTPAAPGGIQPGADVRYRLPSGPGGYPAFQGMAGGPMLVRRGQPTLDFAAEDFQGSAPPVTFSRDETLGQNLLPRMAAGITAEGDLLFLAVDGRNFERAPGVTLGDLGRMMQALGAVEAMNLDGGGSKRMVVGGRTLDLPSTEVEVGGQGTPERIRPVHSAILLFER